MTITLDLTAVQLDQLKAYVQWAGERGEYYGNGSHFLRRHDAIKRQLGMSNNPKVPDYEFLRELEAKGTLWT